MSATFEYRTKAQIEEGAYIEFKPLHADFGIYPAWNWNTVAGFLTAVGKRRIGREEIRAEYRLRLLAGETNFRERLRLGMLRERVNKVIDRCRFQWGETGAVTGMDVMTWM
jgi:hypothetical protein